MKKEYLEITVYEALQNVLNISSKHLTIYMSLSVAGKTVDCC